MEPTLSNDFTPSPFFDWYDWEHHEDDWIHVEDDLDYPLDAFQLAIGFDEADSSEIGFYASVWIEENYKNLKLDECQIR